MNRWLVNVSQVGAAALLMAGIAGCNRDASADAGVAGAATGAADAAQYAKVLSVDPVRQTVDNPQQVCRDEVVTHTAPPKDQHQIAGTAIGAVLGGVLGNQIGGGRGRTLATVGGAVAGGYAGKRVEEAHQEGTTTSSTVRRCSTVNNPSNKIVAYDVRYEFKGVQRTVRMDHDPGDRLEVQEGVVSVSDAR